MINLNEVNVVGADPAVLSWPVTARLDSIGIVPNKMQIRTTGTSAWKAIDINPGQDSSGDGNPANDADQGGTLWVFEKIGGKWHASGAERLRPSQLNGDKPVADPSQGGLSTLIGGGWLYDANRWGAMAGVNPKAGDIVGFMVTSGSTRLDTTSREKERTDIIVCRWPDATGRLPFEEVWREGSPVTQQPPATPPAAQPPTAPPTSDEHARHRERLTALEGANTATNDKIDALFAPLEDRVSKLEQKPSGTPATPAPLKAYVRVFGVSFPVTFEG